MSEVVVVGSCNLDLIVRVPRLPLAGETVLGGDMISRPGGKGANQAVAARRLGKGTTFMGAVGNDRFAQTVRDALAAAGLDLAHLVTVDGPTGVAVIVVDGTGANQITVAPGANRELTPAHVRGLDRYLTASAVLLLQLEIPLPTCVAAASLARESGGRVVLNAAPILPIDTQLRRLLSLADVLIVNEREAQALLPDAHPTTVDAWPGVVAQLRAFGPSTAIVTLGADGAAVADATETFLAPSPRVHAVDTTGAGDAFCGGLAAALADSLSLSEAVRRACAAGALATTAMGAQSALPTAAQLDDLLARAVA
jgi:ribokinase